MRLLDQLFGVSIFFINSENLFAQDSPPCVTARGIPTTALPSWGWSLGWIWVPVCSPNVQRGQGLCTEGDGVPYRGSHCIGSLCIWNITVWGPPSPCGQTTEKSWPPFSFGMRSIKNNNNAWDKTNSLTGKGSSHQFVVMPSVWLIVYSDELVNEFVTQCNVLQGVTCLYCFFLTGPSKSSLKGKQPKENGKTVSEDLAHVLYTEWVPWHKICFIDSGGSKGALLARPPPPPPQRPNCSRFHAVLRGNLINCIPAPP